MDIDSVRSVREELPAHGEWIRKLARSLTRDDASADDLAQEAALVALRKAPAESSALAPWLARVTRNFAHRGWRDAARRAQRERAAARPEGLPGADEAAERLETQRLLVDELAALDTPVRHALVRRYLDGWSAARIARETGEPASTVRWRLQRGLAEMRLRLDRRGGRDGVSWRLALAPLCVPTPRWPFAPRAHAPHGLTSGGVATISGALAMKVVTQWAIAAAAVLAVGFGVWWGVERTSSAPPNAVERVAPLAQALSEPRAELPDQSPTARAQVAGVESPAAEPTRPPVAEPTPPLIDGRCLDEQLAPIAGVNVALADAPSDPTATTAADGTFSLDGNPVGWRGERDFVFESEPFAKHFVTAELAPGSTTHLGDVILKKGGVVRGQVVGPDGAAVAGARVVITTPDLWSSLAEAAVRGPSVRHALNGVSGADGRFRMAGVTLGPMRAWASAEGMRWTISPPVEVHADAESPDVELVLERLRADDAITGRVVTPTGEPVPGASLSGMDRSGVSASSFMDQTDGAGRFELSAKPDHVYDLFVSDPHDRWAPVAAKAIAPGTRDVELRFSEAHWIEVSVRAGGSPLTEFDLSAMGSTGTDWLASARRETHAGGRARLRVPGEPFFVQIDARGYELAKQGPFTRERFPDTLTFELEPQAGVRGIVVAGGKPLPGAQVTLCSADPKSRIAHQGYPSLVNPRPEDKTVSDAEGRFTLQLRAHGTFFVRATADGYAASDVGPFELDPATGSSALELDLGRGGAIEGRVIMPAGRDVAGVIVAVNGGDAHPRTVRSDEQGNFRFEGLTAGPWQLSRGRLEVNAEGGGTTYSIASEPTRIPFNCSVVEGKTTRMDLDLRDWAPCQVAGRLLIKGAPAANWVVIAWPGGSGAVLGSPPATAVASDGTFSIEVEEAGALALAFSPPAESGAQGSFRFTTEVRAGANTWSRDLAIGRLSGHGVHASPSSEQGVCYVFNEGPLTCAFPIQPDANGHFVLPFVPAGKGAISQIERGAAGLSWKVLVEVDVPAGGERTVELP